MERDTRLIDITTGDLTAIVSAIVGEQLKGFQSAISDMVTEIVAGNDTLVGGEEIARALGVNRNTMYKMIHEGKLPCVKHYGKKLTARRSELYDAISNIQQ